MKHGTQLSADTFFIGELSNCAQGRVTTALGKNKLIIVPFVTRSGDKKNKESIEGVFVTRAMARKICAHCLKNNELSSDGPLPFRLFVGNQEQLTEIQGQRAIFSNIGYRPKGLKLPLKNNSVLDRFKELLATPITA